MNCEPGQEAVAAKVEAFSDPQESGCWNWGGSRSLKGYGRMWWQGKLHAAHRLAYQAWHGSIPAGMQVMHRCDNPSCVNPDHLGIGTNQDNVDDKLRKGRIPRGESRRDAKLTEAAVIDIRSSSLTHAALGRKYGVCQELVRDVRAGKRWPHVRPDGITTEEVKELFSPSPAKESEKV